MQHRYEAVEQLRRDLIEYRIELTDAAEERFNEWVERELPVWHPLIACEHQSKCHGLEIATLKGKNTRKRWHPSITRKDNGYWEANSYPL